MCNACGKPAPPGHWTEAGAATAGDRLRARFHRVGVLNAILRPYGLSAHDGGAVPGIQLSTLSGAQVIVQGKRLTTTRARDYAVLKPKLLGAVLESFQRLRSAHDLVIVEGV